jgi:hypothetical protein
MITCDIPIERESLQVCLDVPRVLSYVGGRQGCRLSENGDARREGIFVLEYARTQSIVTVQRRFRTKFGKDPPVKNSIKQWYKKFQRGWCLCIAKRTGRPGPSEERVERGREAFQRSPLSPQNER